MTFSERWSQPTNQAERDKKTSVSSVPVSVRVMTSALGTTVRSFAAHRTLGGGVNQNGPRLADGNDAV